MGLSRVKEEMGKGRLEIWMEEEGTGTDLKEERWVEKGDSSEKR